MLKLYRKNQYFVIESKFKYFSKLYDFLIYLFGDSFNKFMDIYTNNLVSTFNIAYKKLLDKEEIVVIKEGEYILRGNAKKKLLNSIIVEGNIVVGKGQISIGEINNGEEISKELEIIVEDENIKILFLDPRKIFYIIAWYIVRSKKINAPTEAIYNLVEEIKKKLEINGESFLLYPIPMVISFTPVVIRALFVMEVGGNENFLEVLGNWGGKWRVIKKQKTFSWMDIHLLLLEKLKLWLNPFKQKLITKLPTLENLKHKERIRSVLKGVLNLFIILIVLFIMQKLLGWILLLTVLGIFLVVYFLLRPAIHYIMLLPDIEIVMKEGIF